MTAVSIIHAPGDEAFGAKIAAALLRQGHAAKRVSGDPLTGDLGLDENVAIVIWSDAAVKLARIREQAREALARGVLIPVAIGGATAPREFNNLAPVDLSGWAGDENDPRWRFALEEIDLAARRADLKDGVIWATAEEPQADPAPADSADEAALENEEALSAPAAVDFEEETTPEDEETPSAPAIENDPLWRLEENGGEEETDAVRVAAFSSAPQRPPRFALRQVALGAGVGLIALTAVAALLAPAVFSPLNRVAAPSVPADEMAERTETSATIAFVKPADANAPPPSKPSGQPAEDGVMEDGAMNVAAASGAENLTTPVAGGGETAAADADGAAALEIVEEASLQQAETPVAAPQLRDAENLSAAPPATDPATDNTSAPPASGDTDALADLVAVVTAEAEQEKMTLAELNPLPEAATEHVNLGNYFRECLECPDMAALPAGTFFMGAPAGELARRDTEGPVTEITIAKSFAIGTREVTFEQWDACVADGGCRAYAPPSVWGREKQPVVNVSFEDAQSYVAWLSAKTGQNYRLPSEAEWEYAARAGASTPLAFGDRLSPDQANYAAQYPYRGPKGENRGRTTKVASFPPNGFGLFDMHGNVWEWTADCWAPNHANAAADGSPRLGNCTARVLKGGAYNTGGWRLRSAHRISKNAAARENDNGFRVARDFH